jgi:hypothetical protein
MTCAHAIPNHEGHGPSPRCIDGIGKDKSSAAIMIELKAIFLPTIAIAPFLIVLVL